MQHTLLVFRRPRISAAWSGIPQTGLSKAFNTLNRDAILNYVATDLPEILNFLKVCYDQSSHLCFGDYTLLSDEGAQQGDPFALCCFVLQQIV